MARGRSGQVALPSDVAIDAAEDLDDATW